MEKENFMTILHEGEVMDEMELDVLKGGDCIGTYCEGIYTEKPPTRP